MVPAGSPCAERQRLLDRFVDAATDLLEAESDQIVALANGNPVPLEPEVHAARQRKEQARQAIKDHRHTHGC